MLRRFLRVLRPEVLAVTVKAHLSLLSLLIPFLSIVKPLGHLLFVLLVVLILIIYLGRDCVNLRVQDKLFPHDLKSLLFKILLFFFEVLPHLHVLGL